MNKYPIVPLGEVCDFVYGDSLKETNRKGGNVPVYGSNGIVGWHDEAITKGETIIIGRKGSIGEIHLSKVPCWAIDTTYYVDKTKVPCDFTWLYYTLKALDLTRLNKSAAVPGLNREDAYEQKIPLPPLEEQKRIASLLARADRLRQLRRAARALADSLLQSVFLEMFGDALTGNNPKIPLVPLETLCTKITDGTHVTPNYVESGVPFISIKDLTKTPGKIDFSDTKFISREEHEKISKLSNVERDDILYTKVGSYGIAQIVDTDREFSIFVSIALLKPDKSKILPKFLEVVMNSSFVKKQADTLVSGIGVPDLHLREIKTFQIPLPPLSLQEEFARVAARVEQMRARQAESERQVENLFESLLAESFGGA